MRFLYHTQRRTKVGRTPLDEWSARSRDLYLTTHNTHNRQKSMPPDGIQTHDLSRRAAVDLRLRPRGHWDRLSFIHDIEYLHAFRTFPVPRYEQLFIGHDSLFTISFMFIKSTWPLLSFEVVTNTCEICALLVYCGEYSFNSL